MEEDFNFAQIWFICFVLMTILALIMGFSLINLANAVCLKEFNMSNGDYFFGKLTCSNPIISAKYSNIEVKIEREIKYGR